MPRTPDRFPGPTYEEGVYLESVVDDPATVGEVRLVGSDFKARDGLGIFNLRSGSGLTESAHNALRQLIHFIDDGPADGWASGMYKELLPSGDPFPAQEIWWTTPGKTHKIVSLDITRNGNKTPATEVWKIYDVDGSTALVTVTDTIAYSGVFETTRTRTWA
jgi:hypothetical protein